MVANSGPYTTFLRSNGGRFGFCCMSPRRNVPFLMAVSGLGPKRVTRVILMPTAWEPSGVEQCRVTCCWPLRFPIPTLSWPSSLQCCQVCDVALHSAPF